MLTDEAGCRIHHQGLMHSKLIFAIFAIFVGIVIKVAVSSGGEPTTRNSGSSNGSRRFFDDIQKMKSSFDEQDIRIDVQQGKVAGISYAIVKAYPYSGPASVDLYCYILDQGAWRLYTLLFVERSLQHLDITEKPDGIEIVNDGAVLLRLNLKKECEPAFEYVPYNLPTNK